MRKKNEFPFSPIDILGNKYRVFLAKKKAGGWFYSLDQEIYIGSEHEKDRATEILLHEIAEAVLVDGGFRYTKYCKTRDGVDNSGYRFVMNHEEFELFIKGLHLALKPLLKPLPLVKIISKKKGKRGRPRKRKKNESVKSKS